MPEFDLELSHLCGFLGKHTKEEKTQTTVTLDSCGDIRQDNSSVAWEVYGGAEWLYHTGSTSWMLRNVGSLPSLLRPVAVSSHMGKGWPCCLQLKKPFSTEQSF